MKQKVQLILVFFIIWVGLGYAEASILVVAPHPDDDILIAAGVTMAATERGEQVTVVYVTNGDFLGVSQGYLRQDEAVAAQAYLGVTEQNLIFLGYPDGYLRELYTLYTQSGSIFVTPNGQSITYGNRGLGGMDYHTYHFGAPAAYNGYNLVLDLTSILTTLRPDHIVATAEFDQHPDHATTYLAVHDAILAATTADPSYIPTLNKSLVWSIDSNSWPNARDPQSYFVEPPGLSDTGVQWNERESLDVPVSWQSQDLIVNMKYQALQSHVSQGGAGSFLGRFIHKDEFFWSLALNGGNRPPRVDAGTDQTVNQGAFVQLNGSGSSDLDGTSLHYQWRQVSGDPVILTKIGRAHV